MLNRVIFFGVAVSVVALAAHHRPAPRLGANPTRGMNDSVLYAEDFDAYENGTLPPNWWAEGCKQVFVQEGRLRIKADPDKERGPGHACTVWNETSFSGAVQVAFDAHVIASSIKANNVNFFLHYTHPGQDSTLQGTSQLRLDGGYGHYHDLNGYIFTYVNTRRTEKDEARFRMRRCPGFELMDENYAYHNRAGETHHVTITKRGDRLTYAVDGTVYLQARDEKYDWREGLMGLRTFHTDLWVDNLTVARPGAQTDS